VFYNALGRIVWTILRGYLRHRFPHARRNLAIAAVAGVAAGTGVVLARRPTGGAPPPQRR
jgi:hypothetical protein